MSHGRRTRIKTGHLHESIAAYLAMQRADTEEEFQRLLAEHGRCTDADGLPRLVPRTLAELRRGPAPVRLPPALQSVVTTSLNFPTSLDLPPGPAHIKVVGSQGLR